METIRGKMSQNLDLDGLNERVKNYQRVMLDLGTGDGRYVRSLADQASQIGSSSAWTRAAKICANIHAQNCPKCFSSSPARRICQREFNGLISHVTINFPWGSLLESLLAGDAALDEWAFIHCEANAQIDIHLNGGALAEAGTDLEAGTQKIYDNVNH